MFRSIGSKINLLLCILLTSAIVVYLIATLWIVDNSQRQHHMSSFNRTEQVVESLLASQSDEISNEAKLVGVLPILATVVENNNSGTILDTARSYQQDLGVNIFEVLDNEGTFLANVDSLSKGQDIPPPELVKAALEGNSQVTLALRNGYLAVLGAAPIGISRDPSGVLILGVYLDDAFASKVAGLTKTEISFILSDGTIAGSSLAAEGRANLLKILAPLAAELAADSKESAFQDTGSYLIKTKPFLDSDGKLVGNLLVQLPLTEAKETLASIFKLAFFIAMGILLISLMGGLVFTRSITNPIAKLRTVVVNIIGTHDLQQRVEVISNDEIGELSTQFNRLLEEIADKEMKLDEYSRSLEGMVEARTRELRQHQAETAEMLDHIKLAIFTFDADLLVNPEISRYGLQVFGPELNADRNIAELLFADSNVSQADLSRFNFEMKLLFGSDRLQWTLSSPGFVKEIERNRDKKQFLKLNFEPILDPDGMLTRVLMIVEDVTQIKALEALAESNKRDLEKIADLLSFDDSVCTTFIQETKRILWDCRTELGKVLCSTQTEQQEIINTLFRFVHTIKGNARLFNLNSIQEVAHKAEDYFAGLRDNPELSTLEAKDVTKLIQQVAVLETELATYEDLRHRVLGRGKDGDENSKLSNGQLLWMQSILKRVCQTTPSAASDPQLQSLKTEAQRLLDSVGKTPIRHYIKAYDDMLQQLAPDLNKAVKLIKFTGNCYWIEADLMAQINEILIHCLRNALAHGIESVDIRKAAGKPDEGEISLELWRSDGLLSVLVRDDGRGIHGEEIAKKAVAKGLVTEAKLKMMNQEEIISLIFSPGFSTTDQVNELSGRGVGLDAVRIFTESLGGKIIARATPGLGLVIELKIPDPALAAKIKPLEIAIPAKSDPNLLATLGKLCESQGQSVAINTYQAQSYQEILSHPPNVLKLAFISEEMLDSHSEWKDIIGEDDSLRIVLVAKDLLARRHEGLPAKRCLTMEGPLDECTIRAAFSLVGDNSNNFVQLTPDRSFRSA